MKLIYSLLMLLIYPYYIYSQYDSTYYMCSNYGYKYFDEGEYNKSIHAITLIHDSLLRYRDYDVLLNIYNNRDDTTNLKIIISKFAKKNYSCMKIYESKSLDKYKHLIKKGCHSQFDSIYKTKYEDIKYVILFLDTSIKYSNLYRKKSDSAIVAMVDKNAYLFLKNCKMKDIAAALEYINQRDFNIYINLFTTLIHLNYYDNESSIIVENWAKELMYYGVLEPKDYAYIIDRRICLKGDGKQRYGVHFWKYNSKELEKINKNREEIGLVPLN